MRPGMWHDHLTQIMTDLTQRNLDRRLFSVDRVQGARAEINGRSVLLFCSNDYLGYTGHPALQAAATEALAAWGTGAGASRLISGNLAPYVHLEADLARFKHTEAALVFPTGYQANLGVVTALAGPQDLILSDALNHASLVDAIRLTRAEVKIIPHADAAAFRAAMNVAGNRRVMIVTDGVFSMDGDLAPLVELATISRDSGALLVVDDAHGTGVLGRTGRGSLEHLGVDPEGLVQVGTFSKALGGLGGFVAGPELVVRCLLSRARTLIYTTGLPPATVVANRRALALVDEEPEARARLRANVNRLRSGLADSGLTLIPGPTAIVPILIGQAGPALALARALLDRGLYCPAIRPPTVPPGQCRLRLAVSAAHTEEEIDWAAGLLLEVAGGMGMLERKTGEGI